jgi:hypothetical protein
LGLIHAFDLLRYADSDYCWLWWCQPYEYSWTNLCYNSNDCWRPWILIRRWIAKFNHSEFRHSDSWAQRTIHVALKDSTPLQAFRCSLQKSLSCNPLWTIQEWWLPQRVDEKLTLQNKRAGYLRDIQRLRKHLHHFF